jgi:hypothetical protein
MASRPVRAVRSFLCTPLDEVVDGVQPHVYVAALAQEGDDFAVRASAPPKRANQHLVGVELRRAPFGRACVEHGANGLTHRHEQREMR